MATGQGGTGHLAGQLLSATLAMSGLHGGERQDAPVVGIEGVRVAPQSVSAGRVAAAHYLLHHPAQPGAPILPLRVAAHGVHAADALVVGLNKLRLLGAGGLEVPVEHLLDDVREKAGDDDDDDCEPGRAAGQQLDEDKVHVLGVEERPDDSPIKNGEDEVESEEPPGNKSDSSTSRSGSPRPASV